MYKIILFVDDEPAILNSIKRVFRKSPHIIMTASNATDALEIIRSNDVCVLVSDYSMPNITGANLLAQAKSIRPDMVRIILSGNNDQEATIQSINQGAASRFLTKPWNDKDLIDEVETALEQWEFKQYHFHPKRLLNQHALLNVIENDIKNDDTKDRFVAYISINNFESLKNNASIEDLEIFLIDVAPEFQSLNEQDCLALMEDQHFCAYIRVTPEMENIENAITSLLKYFSDEISINGRKVKLTYNVGYSIIENTDSTATTQVDNAFTALQHTVSNKSTNIFQFTYQMRAQINHNLILESNLNNALSNNELILFYQPKINLSNNSLHGAEALIRWNNSELGMVSPFDFIPLAERSNLINEIGEWVIVEAFNQWSEWFGSLPVKPLISVNVSPKQLTEARFIERVEKSLAAVSMDPVHLELEITESLMVTDIDATIDVLNQLKQLGLKLSIDDFGTGYSSLSYLNKLPIDIIKIDRSFILPILESRANYEMVKNLIRLGHDLDMQIVAEGVEDEQQLTVLHEFGCDVVQGYYFSPPLPANEFIQYSNSLERENNRPKSTNNPIAIGQ